MSRAFPIVHLARHGETAWTITGQHTGLSDLPLTERGEQMARRIGDRLNGATFAKVLTSPLRRAFDTCSLAGFAAVAEVDHDLVEWDYGNYEGWTSAEILAERPGWQLFRDGCPGGESVREVAARAERVIQRLRATDRDVLLFSSGHFLRMLAARWIGAAPILGQSLMLSTGSLSSLTHERQGEPVIRQWNDGVVA